MILNEIITNDIVQFSSTLSSTFEKSTFSNRAKKEFSSDDIKFINRQINRFSDMTIKPNQIKRAGWVGFCETDQEKGQLSSVELSTFKDTVNERLREKASKRYVHIITGMITGGLLVGGAMFYNLSYARETNKIEHLEKELNSIQLHDAKTENKINDVIYDLESINSKASRKHNLKSKAISESERN